jgi:hypothetical protein
MSRRQQSAATAIGALAVLLSCDSGPPSGDLTVEFSSGQPQLAAVMFEVTATDPHTIDALAPACSGCQLFTARVSERVMRGILTGAVSAGPVVRVTVPDVRVPEGYTVRLMQLAQADYTLVTLVGSSLSIPTER